MRKNRPRPCKTQPRKIHRSKRSRVFSLVLSASQKWTWKVVARSSLSECWWKSLPVSVFADSSNLFIFKSKVNEHLTSYIPFLFASLWTSQKLTIYSQCFIVKCGSPWAPWQLSPHLSKPEFCWLSHYSYDHIRDNFCFYSVYDLVR